MAAKATNRQAASQPVAAVDPDPDPSPAKTSTSAIGKAFAILRVLRRAPSPLTLTSIAQEVGMAPSSAHSVLNQLLAQDAVRQDHDKRYLLGPVVFYLGSAYARGASVYRAIWMEMVSAANELGVTAALAVPWDNHHLVLNAHRAGDSDVAVPFGGRVPIAASSWGKVYYGWRDDELAGVIGELQAYTPASIVDQDAFRREVGEARRLGYATDRGEFYPGVGGVASALTSAQGYEGVASFLGPLQRVEELGFDRLGRRVAGLAARASLALGDRDRVSFFGSE